MKNKSGFSLMENLVAIALISIAMLALSKSQALIASSKINLVEFDLALNEVKAEAARVKMLSSDTSVDRTVTRNFKFSGDVVITSDPNVIQITTVTTTVGNDVTIVASRGAKALITKVMRRPVKGMR